MQSVKTPTSKNYQDYLNLALNDPQRAAGNIQMALEEKERLQGLLNSQLFYLLNQVGPNLPAQTVSA